MPRPRRAASAICRPLQTHARRCKLCPAHRLALAKAAGACHRRRAWHRLWRRLSTRARRRSPLRRARHAAGRHRDQWGWCRHGRNPADAPLAREDGSRELTYTGRVFFRRGCACVRFCGRDWPPILAEGDGDGTRSRRAVPMRSGPPSGCSISPSRAMPIRCLRQRRRRAQALLGRPNQVEAVKANLENRTRSGAPHDGQSGARSAAFDRGQRRAAGLNRLAGSKSGSRAWRGRNPDALERRLTHIRATSMPE